MARVAVYECPCCGRRVSQPVPPGARPPARVRCEGWCLRCDGSCRDVARRVSVERDEEDPVAAASALARVAAPVRLVKPSRRLDLPAAQPWDLAW